MQKHILTTVVLMALFAGGLTAQAQTGNIDPANKYAYSENAGWQNFRPTHGGVTVYDDHLEGDVWAENIGWVRLGSYTGGGTHTYANTGAADYGVNNTGAGVLSGYAWSENAGWINFKPTHGGVTINTTTGVFDGYAWGENIGWMHFKNASPPYHVAIQTYTVTPSTGGAGGAITPNTPQTVNSGSAASFTVTPDSGYTVSVSGCGGNLSGTTYTTGAVTADCTVTATFAAAGFTLSKASVAVSEAGTTDTFTVVLTAQPGSDVVFTVTSSDAGEATVSPAALTFTNGNWSTAQAVTVTGVNDHEHDGTQTSTVTVSVNDALSDDAFDALADKTVTVTTTDNDVFQTGQWQDANKDGPDDDDMCWAAAASNLLAWGGWDAGLTSAQAVFDVFEDHWTNDMSRMYEAWRWWLDGTVPGSRAPGAKVDVGGAGGAYQGEYSSAFFVSSMTGAANLLFNTISTALTHAFGVTLGLLNTASADTHALTVWGYDLDASGALLGLHVADSDDGLNQLQYVGVQYDAANSYWTLSSDSTWYIRELNALGTRGGATNAVFGGTGRITGQRYGAGGVKSLDYSDGEQTLVPEPGSLLLVSLGLFGLLGLFRGLRRR